MLSVTLSYCTSHQMCLSRLLIDLNADVTLVTVPFKPVWAFIMTEAPAIPATTRNPTSKSCKLNPNIHPDFGPYIFSSCHLDSKSTGPVQHFLHRRAWLDVNCHVCAKPTQNHEILLLHVMLQISASLPTCHCCIYINLTLSHNKGSYEALYSWCLVLCGSIVVEYLLLSATVQEWLNVCALRLRGAL